MTHEELLETIRNINPSPSLDKLQDELIRLREEVEKREKINNSLRHALNELIDKTECQCTEMFQCVHCAAHDTYMKSFE